MAELEALGARQSTWTDNDRARWDDLNTEWHQIKAQLEKQPPADMGQLLKERGYVNSSGISVGIDRVAYDPRGGFNHFGEFGNDVHQAVTSPQSGITEKLQNFQNASLSTYGSEGIGPDGGYAVPPEFVERITRRVTSERSVAGMCFQMPTASNNITLPDDETTDWASSGGVQAYWESEAGAITQSKPSLKEKSWRLRKCACLVPVTSELVTDAPFFSSWLEERASAAIDWKIGEAVFRGIGTMEPLGFLNASSLVTVAKESGQSADTLVAANIDKMWSRMFAPYRDNAVWFTSQDTEPQLDALVDAGSNAVFRPDGSIAPAPSRTLKGRPIMTTQHCETLGDVGDIVLASMPEYGLARKVTGVQAATSIHLWFDQDITAFRFIMRVDGMPFLSSTISPRDGSNTLSSFVTLAARA
jgi:HK97 family phage major capsid protein